jgi:aryl-alcohol dehydrogenase-like predicted oxidoreductase
MWRRATRRRNLEGFVDRSLSNLGIETLDLVQLHCPPTPVYYMPEVFGALDGLVAKGKLAALRGVGREGRGGAQGHRVPGRGVGPDHLECLSGRVPRSCSFPAAAEKGVAVIARVPLASGLLHGEDVAGELAVRGGRPPGVQPRGRAFDKARPSRSVPYEVGWTREGCGGCCGDVPMAQAGAALVPDGEAVSVVIPGAKNAEQARRTPPRGGAPPLERGRWRRCGASTRSASRRTSQLW